MIEINVLAFQKREHLVLRNWVFLFLCSKVVVVLSIYILFVCFCAQGPCHIELHAALDMIASSQQKLGEKFTTFFLPNCDKHGFYKAKQVRTLGFHRIKSTPPIEKDSSSTAGWFIHVVPNLCFLFSVSHLWLDRQLAAGVCLPGMGRRSQDPRTCSVTQSVIKKSLTEGWTLLSLTRTQMHIDKKLNS